MNSTLTNLQPLAFLITRVVAGYMFYYTAQRNFLNFQCR